MRRIILISLFLILSLIIYLQPAWPTISGQWAGLPRAGFSISAAGATQTGDPLPIEPTEVGVNNPGVAPGAPLAGFGRRQSTDTWVPWVFEIPAHPGLVVKEAVMEVTIEAIDADGDGQADAQLDTDTIEAYGQGGRSAATGSGLFGQGEHRGTPGLDGYFHLLYRSGENPLTPKTIRIDLTKYPVIIGILNTETRLNVIEEDDSSCLGAKLYLTLGPPSPAKVEVKSATKTCAPVDAYPRINAQPAAGPNFPAIAEQPPTQITCTLEVDVALKEINGDRGPVNLTIFDGLSPGLFFDKIVSASPGTTVESYTSNVVTFSPIRLELPPQTVLQSFPIKLVYTTFLNDLAEQRFPQQNCITLRFTDAATGNVLLNQPGICLDITPLIPRFSIIKYASSTTGLPGDKRTFTVLAYNTGNIFLQNINLDAIIPNNMTLDQASITPPGATVVGNRIQWRGLGPIDASSSLAVSYAATINANTPEGTQLTDQAFATATAPDFAGSGSRQLNATSNQITLVVSPIRVGVDLTLTSDVTQGCSLKVVTHSLKVTNMGQFTLEQLHLTLKQATLSLAGNPTFPMDLEPLPAGQSRTITYKGQLGLQQKGVLVDVITVTGTAFNNGVQVAPPVTAVATANVQVLPPLISKITPATAPQGSSNLELKIEGACFVPGTVVGFQPGSGIEIITPLPPNYGFVGSTELRQSINIKSDAALGEREVGVVNPNGVVGGQRPFNLLTITKGSPTLARLSPDSGQVGTQVTITGANFSTIPTENIVRFGSIQAEVTSASLTNLITKVPTGVAVATVPVTVTTAGQGSNSVNFEVYGNWYAPVMTMTPESLDFGTVQLGQYVDRTISIQCTGYATLNLYALSSSHPDFSVLTPTVPLDLDTWETAKITVRFTPTAAGTQTGTLLVSSNVEGKQTIPVQLRGEVPGGTLTDMLKTDDGTAETAGIGDGLIIVNRLTPSSYPATLRSIRIFFVQLQGLPSPVGEQIRLIAFADPSGSGQPPSNPSLLVNQTVTIPSIPASGGFIDFPVTASSSITSGDIYIGYQAPRPARGVGFAADSSGPQQQRAFYSTNDGASYDLLAGIGNLTATAVHQPAGVTQANIMLQASVSGAALCTYTISPGYKAFDGSGGIGTVTVTAPTGCTWTASSPANWVNLNSVTPGSGNGTVSYSVTANIAPRRATVTIAGQPFTVAQAEQVASFSSASYKGSGLAAEAIASAFGNNLATSTQVPASLPLPTTLAGTRVLVKDSAGTELLAPLFFVSPTQVNFLMPPGAIPGAATVTVTNANGTTSIGTAQNDAVAPGLFTANADGQGIAAAVAVRVKPDWTQIFETVAQFEGARWVSRPIDLGPPGEVVVLELFGTGLRYRSSLAAVTVTIGGVQARVDYAGPQGGFAGLDQINVLVPRSLIGRGEVDIVLTADGRVANTIKVNIK